MNFNPHTREGCDRELIKNISDLLIDIIDQNTRYFLINQKYP